MGRRDYRKRETKKPRKDAKKLPPTPTIIQPTVTVEVIKKRRKEPEEEPPE